uniref:Copper type II ascorbate-dependent monooxygenase N-terminal domain-containing protein n=1 Tax=Strigamia maritima TaxID=126957 RepID=T1IHZ3_STRMM
MLLYGCVTPGKEYDAWSCGEIQESSSHYKTGPTPVCGKGSQIMYAWAKDAPKLDLPEGVGFKIGKNTDVKYLVLQVHYLDVSRFIDGGTDDSGVFLRYTETPMPRLAGVYLIGTNGFIPAKKEGTA